MAKKFKLDWWQAHTPPSMSNEFAARGARGLKLMMADVHDGELRLIIASEPFFDDGSYGVHVSASVGRKGETRPFRRPTNQEMKAVLHLCRKFNLAEVTAPSNDARHLWSVSPSEQFQFN